MENRIGLDFIWSENDGLYCMSCVHGSVDWFFPKLIIGMIGIGFLITVTDAQCQGLFFWPTTAQFLAIWNTNKVFFFLIKIGLSSPISIHQPDQDFKQIQNFIYLAIHNSRSLVITNYSTTHNVTKNNNSHYSFIS